MLVTHLSTSKCRFHPEPSCHLDLRQCLENDADMQEAFGARIPAYLMRAARNVNLAEFWKCYLNQTTASSLNAISRFGS